MSYDSIFLKRKMTHQIDVDSCGHFDIITTIHEPHEHRLKNTVPQMRDSFEAGELSGVIWVDGRNNLADFLTKWNIEVSKKQNVMSTNDLGDEEIRSNLKAWDACIGRRSLSRRSLGECGCVHL